MIVYPADWCKDYGSLVNDYSGNFCEETTVKDIVGTLHKVLEKINVNHIAYSGGVDSSVLLCLLTNIFEEVNTYTIASRDTHKDVEFARLGSSYYGSKHKEFIVSPTSAPTDEFTGDNAVRQLYENIFGMTDELVCGDGIDEFMCGYHKHKDLEIETYKYFLGDLLPGHLLPLNLNSAGTKVYLPYLDSDMIDLYRMIPLEFKVDSNNRKKVMSAIAEHLGVPRSIIYRHKYGFIDAFLTKEKNNT